jgi:hypothetical protein
MNDNLHLFGWQVEQPARFDVLRSKRRERPDCLS